MLENVRPNENIAIDSAFVLFTADRPRRPGINDHLGSTFSAARSLHLPVREFTRPSPDRCAKRPDRDCELLSQIIGHQCALREGKSRKRQDTIIVPQPHLHLVKFKASDSGEMISDASSGDFQAWPSVGRRMIDGRSRTIVLGPIAKFHIEPLSMKNAF